MAKGGKGGGNGAISGNKRDNHLTGTEEADLIQGNAGNDTLEGLGGGDTLEGGTGADLLIGGAGDDSIDGGADADVVVLTGNRDDYVVTQIDEVSVEISGAEGVDFITNVESFQFADMTQTLAEVVIPRDPNLSAANLAASAVQVVEGDALILDWDVTSDGVVDAGSSATRILIATAPDSGSVVQTVDSQPTGTLATGTTTGYSESIDTSGLAPGTYYISAVADGGDVLAESDETDNATGWVQVVVLAAEPNLSAGNIAADDVDLIEGDVATITWDIVSDGTVDAGTSVTELVIATDPDLGSVIQSFDATDTGVLTTGSTSSYTGQVDTSGLAAGTYWVAALADAGGALAESDETDNVSGWVQIVVEDQRNDFAMDSVDVLPTSDLNLNTDPLSPGTPAGWLDLTLTATNDSNVGMTDYEFTVWLSTDNVLSADDFMLSPDPATGGPLVQSIAYGETLSFEWQYELDAQYPQGDYYVIAAVNAYGGSGSGPSDDPSDNVAVTATPVSLVGGWTYGTSGDDLFVGDQYAERFEGGDGDDTLTGDILGDVFYGGAGVDTLDLSQSAAGITIFGNYDPFYAATNSLTVEQRDPNGAYNPETATGGAEDIERIIGSDHDDQIGIYEAFVTEVYGGAGNDFIVGSVLDDTIDGGTGDDLLAGYLGDDIITTGDGADTVVGLYASDGAGGIEAHGNDVITDFDVTQDLLVFQIDATTASWNPLDALTQTAEGVMISLTPDDSVFLPGILMGDLNETNLGIYDPDDQVSVTY